MCVAFKMDEVSWGFGERGAAPVPGRGQAKGRGGSPGAKPWRIAEML